MIRTIVSLSILTAAAAACSGAAPNPSPPAPSLPPVVTATDAPSAKAAPRFENPGGMWTPEQLRDHGKELRGLGLALDPAQLTSPTSPLLQSVVSLGGCSASFVSPDGLIATNHHCSTSALQYNATPTENLLEIGFLARTKAEERWNGPTARVFVTQAFRDVTSEIRAGLDAITDDLARFEKVEERTKQIVSACEKERKGTRCSVASYFGGAQFTLIEQLEIKDVRLVYAPHEGIGNFGGEIDNWRWPRHGGDFAFFRAYVGPDGKPADHAKENIPYRPPHHLALASEPLSEGDLVMVAGYPGTTNRLRTAAEVEEAVSWLYPRRIKFCEEYITLLQALSKQSKEIAIKANPTERGIHNGLTKFKGVLEGLETGGLAKQKVKLERDLEGWMTADPARKAEHGEVVPRMAKLYADHQKTRDRDAAQAEIFSMPKLLGAAQTIVRMAEERAKPDAERDPAYQERNWQRLEQSQVALQKSYDKVIDRAMLRLALERAMRLPEASRPPVMGAILGPKASAATAASLDAPIAALFAKTQLEDPATRVKLLKTATTAQLKASSDPLIRLALDQRPVQKAIEDEDERYSGAMSVLRPRYIEALRGFLGGRLAPDANGTLRVTYGTVRGYRPKPDATPFTPFTKVSEMLKKHTGEDPFIVPPALQAAAKAGKFGPYVDASIGEVPIDFLSDLDITGGNSGSATLNRKGELVGLAFDGNYEAMGSDWLFMPDLTRTIHVDLRYVLWVMDAVDGADHLLREMGRTPAVP